MNPAQKILDRFGGLNAAARALGLPVSTVQHWGITGFVPARRQPLVLEKARELGVDIKAEDFFEDPPPDPIQAAQLRPTG